MPPDAPRPYPARPREVAPTARNVTDGLNPDQLAAATHGDGPLLIVAGAGTGKTRTLVHRVAHLLERGTPPERILLLTFTRRAAQEMLARTERLVGAVSRQVHGGTFHSTGHRLLRRFGQRAGLGADFTILDSEDAAGLMQLARSAAGVADKGKRFPKKETLHQLYSRHVNTDIPVEQLLGDEYPQFHEFAPEILRIFVDYTERKAARNLVDYDDLLLFWLALLEAPGIGDELRALYDHVLVDEYQDTNTLQARLLHAQCRGHRNLTVVGDDAQSIYAFRGATIRNILDFPATWPGTRLVTLAQNYRSTQPILGTSNTLISRAAERFTKDLWTTRSGGEPPWLVTASDEAMQTRFVCDHLLTLHEEGTPLREMAVLFRAGFHSADLEIELTARGIPFEKWGGIKFLEAAHVKDVLAFLRILENPRDEVSWYRVLTLLPGVGDSTARNAIQSLADAAWDAAAFGAFNAPPRAKAAHGALVSLLATLRRGVQPGDRRVAAEIAQVRGLYDDLLREKYDKADPRLADLDQLETIAAGYPDRGAFLAALALEPPQHTSDLGFGGDSEDDVLVLSTVHSAKGREWDAVFVLWAVDGWFPMGRALGSEEEIEEERRLMYVALTRARDHLFVSYPVNVYASRRGADYGMDQLSRFLDRGVRETMQRVVVEPPPPPEPPPGQRAMPEVDVRAGLRARFGG